ncbi:MAG: MMPL family transporter [Deltaproteobacteria bacterium]|nr:MMPL family transporter [Deltaproteobacteria bacterium]
MHFVLRKIWRREYFDRLAGILVRQAKPLLLVGVVLTVVSALFACRLRIDSDYMAFLPENFPGVRNLKKVIEKTGGFGNFVLVLEGGTLESRRTFAEAFAGRATRYPWVDYAEYKKDWDKIEKNKLLYVNLEDLKTIESRLRQVISYEKHKENPLSISLLSPEEEKDQALLDFSDIERKYQQTTFGSPWFEDPGQKYTLAVIWPKGSMTQIGFARQAYADLQKLIDELNPAGFHAGLKADIGGEFRNKIDEYFSIRKDVAGSSLTAFLGICLILFLFYRRLSTVVSVIIPLVMGTAVSFGVASFLVGRLNLMTVFLIAILIGLGIEYGIYLFSRYAEERPRQETLEKTIAGILFDTGRATLSSALTAAMAFGLLVFMEFKGFREFGLLAAVGLMVVFLSYFVYAPVLWALGEKWGFIQAGHIPEPSHWLRRVPLGKWVIWGGIGLTVLCLISLPFFSFEFDYGKLRSRTSAYWTLNSKIHAVFPLSKTPAVVITDTLEETRGVVDAIEGRMAGVKTIDAVKSVLDLIPSGVQEKKEVLARIEELIRHNYPHMKPAEQKTADRYLPYLHPSEIRAEDLPRGLVRQFTGLPGTPGYMVFIYDKVRLSDARQAAVYADDIREIKTKEKTYYPAEGSILFADALSLMKRDSLIAFWAMLVGIYLVLMWDFRSAKDALIVVCPLVMGLLFTFGLMVVFGIRLNIFNLVIFPILMGIGIDSSIHLYHTYRQGRNDESLAHMVSSTGSSLVLATLTSMLGFAGMVFTDHQGLKTAGLTAVIGMGCNLIACIGFFPAFLKWKGHLIPRRVRKKAASTEEMIGVFREKAADAE